MRQHLFDMHCHLDFDADPRALADGLAACGVGGLSVTVTPEGYRRAARLFAPCGNVRVGAGLHPWWVEECPAGEALVEQAVENAAAVSFVGEVGLDFGPKHAATRDVQVAVFDRIARACAAQGGKVLSLHAVRSASVVLDVLERRDVLGESVCILHWFSGTSDELQRAIKRGCYFSVGERMLSTKRGRAYIRAIPLDRLLLETDLPPEKNALEGGVALRAQALVSSLQTALDQLTALRSEEASVIAEHLARTSRAVLGGGGVY